MRLGFKREDPQQRLRYHVSSARLPRADMSLLSPIHLQSNTITKVVKYPIMAGQGQPT